MPSFDDSQFVDYYLILAVEPTATIAEVKSAYRQAAKKAHPDAGGSAAAMDQINEAYGVLGDLAKRAMYDQERRLHYAPPPPTHSSQSQYAPQDSWSDQQAAARAELNRLRIAYARRSGFEIIKWSIVAGAGLGALMWLFGGQITQFGTRVVLLIAMGAAGFGLIFGATCITDPDHRLVLLDMSWHHRQFPTKQWWLITTAQFGSGVILGAGVGWWVLSQAPSSVFGT